MVDWTGQAEEAAEKLRALARQRRRVTDVVAQLERIGMADLPALQPVHWQSEAQRSYSDQQVELHGLLERAAGRLERAVDAIDQALRSASRAP